MLSRLTIPTLLRSTFSTSQTFRLACAATGVSTRNSTTSTNNIRKSVPSAIARKLHDPDEVDGPHRFREFELNDRVYIVTGGAQGLGLTLAEALVEAGGHVYCVDRRDEPAQDFYDTRDRLAKHYGGSLHYRKVDVQHAPELEEAIDQIASERSRLDGLIAAAGVQYVSPALDYPPEKISEMMNINFGGVYLSAVACARQMVKHKTPGSIVLIGSMSGLIANKGFTASVYNSSKGAVIQLGRSLAMEWGKIIDGKAIRVNVLCPGNIMTPMVKKNFDDDPQLRELWEQNNMMGRISEPGEYRGAALFMLSDASSFMTGSHLVIDGGYTAW
ncbi:Short chain dehydrogenases/reductase [Fulvia fulva]|uniref:Short chain dehydrogenases/reductase n=1 Tax=Passalora fulva TaxID=5499 RepID=A0A9Q8PDD9_PASFU|nr:Short chain dehydrogenases/reductase [Fulvia fulva]KAK4619846.1 Short chain dehydrogenases/reductase [Fulvia fulva]KAK4620760.1 Short chain dehydrogenases/reductase [Fulvia fulva]UJO20347.1 Short chain dehydrogenases/reductase [Fulvia fulva]WPV17107.1 Short chain dehydrogenases/reductase [Fulvia fulva]WPV32558.1 Short chain dehydrogenases/reductase [Fulvia fulva]